METPTPSYRQHRYPAEIIAQCVRLYFRFALSYRDVEELMFERGVVVSYETIRRWCHKFGPIMQQACAGVGPSQRTKGSWMRCTSR